MTKHLAFAALILLWGNDCLAGALKFSKLEENETIVVDFRSTGCFHEIFRQYLVRGGAKKIFSSTDQKVEWRDGQSRIVGKKLLGDLELTARDLLGLDALLLFYEATPSLEGGCTTSDVIQVEYYRDRKLLGRDKFTDGTCATSMRSIEGVQRYYANKVGPSVMRYLISFGELDQRILARETR